MFADAEAYEQFMGRWSRILAPQLVEFTDVPEVGRNLDVGSGTGALSFALAERKPKAHVKGIDLSKQYVEYASSTNPSPERVDFEVGDAQHLRFADASFDTSLSMLVFNFIPDPAKALDELRRVTKPGGRISASVWDYGAGMQMLRIFWDAAVRLDPKAEKIDEKHMKLCRSGQLSELWRKGGLENVQEQPHVLTTRFESFANYWNAFLLGQGPAGAYVKSRSAGQVSALRDEVKSRLAPVTEDKPIVLSARAWSVRGTVPMGA